MLKRTRILTTSIATLSTAAIATSALAGGLDEPAMETPVIEAPVVAPVPQVQASAFEGAYVGGQLGYGDVTASGGIEGDGAIYGVHGGYNFAVAPGYLVGVELDYDAMDIDLDPGAGTLDSVLRLKVKGGADLGGIFVYGTGGIAEADTSDLGSEQGTFLGLGAAYDLGNQITVGGEYLFHEFDDFDGSGVDVDANTLTARVSYNF